MALTSAQVAKVRMYLGYSDASQGGSPNSIERAISALTADAETLVVATLERLDTLDTALDTADERAGIIEVDNGGVKWAADGMGASRGLVASGRRLVQRLAAILGVCVANDIYAASSSSGPCGLG